MIFVELYYIVTVIGDYFKNYTFTKILAKNGKSNF